MAILIRSGVLILLLFKNFSKSDKQLGTSVGIGGT